MQHDGGLLRHSDPVASRSQDGMTCDAYGACMDGGARAHRSIRVCKYASQAAHGSTCLGGVAVRWPAVARQQAGCCCCSSSKCAAYRMHRGAVQVQVCKAAVRAAVVVVGMGMAVAITFDCSVQLL